MVTVGAERDQSGRNVITREHHHKRHHGHQLSSIAARFVSSIQHSRWWSPGENIPPRGNAENIPLKIIWPWKHFLLCWQEGGAMQPGQIVHDRCSIADSGPAPCCSAACIGIWHWTLDIQTLPTSCHCCVAGPREIQKWDTKKYWEIRQASDLKGT